MKRTQVHLRGAICREVSFVVDLEVKNGLVALIVNWCSPCHIKLPRFDVVNRGRSQHRMSRQDVHGYYATVVIDEELEMDLTLNTRYTGQRGILDRRVRL